MKQLLLLLLAIVLCGAAHAQYTYEWDTSADLSAHGVFCQMQETSTYYEVPVGCGLILPEAFFDSILKKIDTNNMTASVGRSFAQPGYTLTLFSTKKYYAADATFFVHQISYQPTGGGFGYCILYHPGLGTLAKQLYTGDGNSHPWCYLKEKRVMASTRYFILHRLLDEVKKKGF